MYRHTFWGILILLSLLYPNLGAAAYRREINDYAVAFRVQVYESYRHDRRQYQRRMHAGAQAMEVYRLQETDQGRQAVIGWFSAAMDASRPGQEGPMPTLPAIERLPRIDRAGAGDNPGDRASNAESDKASNSTDAPTDTRDSSPPKTRTPSQSPPAKPSLWRQLSQLFGKKATSTVSTGLPATQPGTPGVAPTVPDTGVWQLLEDGTSTETLTWDTGQVMAEVDDSVTPEAFAEVAHGFDPEVASSVPGVTEINARTAGHNLALDSLQSRADAALRGDGTQLTTIVARIESLVTAGQRIQRLIQRSPQDQRDALIQLDPIDDFLWSFREQLHQFSTDNDRLPKDRIDTLRDRIDRLTEQLGN